jgi:hypothetical protein
MFTIRPTTPAAIQQDWRVATVAWSLRGGKAFRLTYGGGSRITLTSAALGPATIPTMSMKSGTQIAGIGLSSLAFTLRLARYSQW